MSSESNSDSNTHAGAREDTADIGTVEMDTEDLLIACSEVAEIGRSVRRIRILNVLAESKGAIKKSDLAREVARREVDADGPRGVRSEEYSRVYISLTQNHYPKLEDVGIIKWSEDKRDHIVPGPEFDRYLSGLHALALSQGLPVESDLGGVGDD